MRYLVALALFCAQSVFAQNTSLSGVILNHGDTPCIIRKVAPAKLGMMIILDEISSSLVNEDGRFQMKFNLEEPTLVAFEHGPEGKLMLLHPEDNISLSVNMRLFDETLVFDGSGSKRNNILNNLSLIEETLYEDLDTLMSVTDTLMARTIIDDVYRDYMTLVKDYARSESDLAESMNRKIEELAGYKEEWKSRIEKEKRLNKLAGKVPLVLYGIDLNGNEISLEDFKGRITVVDLWATWCGPCKAEMPSLKALEEEYGEKINFVSVAVNDKVDKWKEVAPTFGLTNNMFVSKENEGPLKPLEVSSIPRYIVLDENLQIIDADAPRPSSGDLKTYFK